MSSSIKALLARIPDASLRAELDAAIAETNSTTEFGLVFEKHLPETVRLPHHPIRRGVKVAIRDDPKDRSVFDVVRVGGDEATLRRRAHADGATVDRYAEPEVFAAPLDTLVVLAEFGDPIYPGLKRLGSIDRGGDKPAHVVINAENHHALEMLRFTHAGKIDCIYIDPPYNTGARDWKYDNDYVDTEDGYRHSKWLAFMDRRLRLASELLNPDDAVLIVTVDENEVHRLGLLLEQTFPGRDQQMVTVVMNRTGSTRSGRFTRHEEFVFYVFLGEATAHSWSSTLRSDAVETSAMPTVWFTAIRRGQQSSFRSARPNLFYPVFLDAKTGALHSVGDPLPKDAPRSACPLPANTVALWPLSNDQEQTWRFSSKRMAEYFEAGTARLGKRDPVTGLRPITYLHPNTIREIKDGVFRIVGHTEEGALELALADSSRRSKAPSSVWNVTSHFAREYGSKLLAQLVPGRTFPFPKSLYAVEDSIRVAVGAKPEGVVLDFFGGSGTTTHAVARLNRQDGGRRQSILVTNNEVSVDEAATLSAQGLRDGDAEWEAVGIFEHIARPRITAAITGLTSDGKPITGDYRFTDEFPMAEGFEENVEFLELTYQDVGRVELDRAFNAVAPMLWLRAGGQGPVIEECHDASGDRISHAWTDRYGVLFDTDRWSVFVSELPSSATAAFIVTDSSTTFSQISGELPGHLDVVRLYERYLTTFAINTGGS